METYVFREDEGNVTLKIMVFSHPTSGAPRPFNITINTEDGTACMMLLSYNAYMIIIALPTHSSCRE